MPLPETITVPRTDPIYNCPAYLTKVPIGAIQTFTKPGELVVDFFAGSGMTGLAVDAEPGARLSDISVLGKHIATGYLTDAPARDIRAAAHRVMAAARNALGPLYMTKRVADGAKVETGTTPAARAAQPCAARLAVILTPGANASHAIARP